MIAALYRRFQSNLSIILIIFVLLLISSIVFISYLFGLAVQDNLISGDFFAIFTGLLTFFIGFWHGFSRVAHNRNVLYLPKSKDSWFWSQLTVPMLSSVAVGLIILLPFWMGAYSLQDWLSGLLLAVVSALFLLHSVLAGEAIALISRQISKHILVRLISLLALVIVYILLIYQVFRLPTLISVNIPINLTHILLLILATAGLTAISAVLCELLFSQQTVAISSPGKYTRWLSFQRGLGQTFEGSTALYLSELQRLLRSASALRRVTVALVFWLIGFIFLNQLTNLLPTADIINGQIFLFAAIGLLLIGVISYESGRSAKRLAKEFLPVPDNQNLLLPIWLSSLSYLLVPIIAIALRLGEVRVIQYYGLFFVVLLTVAAHTLWFAYGRKHRR